MKKEGKIRSAKSNIAINENNIIKYEQELGGRGESSIIRYNQLVITTTYYNTTIDTVCSQRLSNRNIKN